MTIPRLRMQPISLWHFDLTLSHHCRCYQFNSRSILLSCSPLSSQIDSRKAQEKQTLKRTRSHMSLIIRKTTWCILICLKDRLDVLLKQHDILHAVFSVKVVKLWILHNFTTMISQVLEEKPTVHVRKDEHVYMHTNKTIIIWFMEIPNYLSGHLNRIMQYVSTDKSHE